MWTVETLNETVDAELEALPADQKAKFIWIGELIQSHGLESVREPYVKHLEQGLWESNEGPRWHVPSNICGREAKAGRRCPRLSKKDPERPMYGN